jgi:thiol-disulfide isomerase/thioredoxin
MAVLKISLIICTLMFSIPAVAQEIRTPLEGDILPDISLTVPKKMQEIGYLGIEEKKGSFTLREIQADVLIIEIFSMYCPYCQKEAPVVNELYQLIQKKQDLKNKVKIIGIGAGNSLFEVNAFRDLYSVPFPLFSDIDFAVHQVLGEVRTPYFIAIKVNKGGSHKVIYSQVGSFGDPHEFLDLILKKSKSKKGA